MAEWISVSVNGTTISAPVSHEEAEKLKSDREYARLWFLNKSLLPKPGSENIEDLGNTSESVPDVNSEKEKNDPKDQAEPNSNSSNCNDQVKSFFWTRPAVLHLLDLYDQHKEKFSSPSWRKKKIWELFSEQFKKLGYTVTGTQIENRWKHMVSMYKNTRDNNKISGASRHTCSYYHEMDGLLGNDPNVEPISTASNRNGISNRDSMNVTDVVPCEDTSPSDVAIPSTSRAKKSKKEPDWSKDLREALKKRMKMLQFATKKK